MFSKTKTLIAALVLIMATATSFADGLPDEQMPIPQPPVRAGGYTGLYLDDTTNFTGFASFLAGLTGTPSSPTASFPCANPTAGNCATANFFEYQAYLSPCISQDSMNCLEGISATKPDGTVEQATLVRNYPETFPTSFKGDVSKNLPDGGSPSLWQFPTVKHSGGNLFLATPNFADWNWVPNSAAPATLSGGIYPVALAAGNYPIPQIQTGSGLSTGYVIGGMETTPDCAMTDGSSCAKIYPFPENTRFSMAIRSNLLVRGFLHGRIDDPNISYSKDSSGVVHLVVEAAPVSVPIFGVWSKNSDLPAALNSLLDSQRMGGRFFYADGSGTRAGTALLRDGRSTGYTQASINEFALWLPVAQDKAYATKTVWGFKTLQDQGGISPCYTSTNSLSGIVTTNATMYESTPPTFNSSTQSLDYKVASPHFDKSGNINSGKYSLVLNSAVARCLYKFTTAPIKATISVVSADGASQVVTTVINEKDGWLHLQASGFTYSSPTISVKLTQDAPAPVATPTATPTPSPTPAASESPTPAATLAPKVPAAVKKLTITCFKGKSIKSIAAIKPTCPVGYKKK